MKEFYKRFKKQGLKKTVLKGIDKILWYRQNWKSCFTNNLKKLNELGPSFLPEYKNPSDKNLMEIEKSFFDNKIKLKDYHVNIDSFNKFLNEFDFGDDFYGGKNNPVWTEKIFEHFVAWETLVKDLKKNEIYIDVAAASSPWVKLLNEKGFKAIGIDLNRSYKFPDDPNYLVMDATKTSFKDESVSGVSLQCAFEMFTGDDDTNLVREFGRILKPGGKAVIVPLYMHTHYCGHTTKDFRFSKKCHDKGAKLYLRKDYTGVPFSRKYDVYKLKERILSAVDESGLKYKIYVLKNGKEIKEGVYCHFILELVKT